MRTRYASRSDNDSVITAAVRNVMWQAIPNCHDYVAEEHAKRKLSATRIRIWSKLNADAGDASSKVFLTRNSDTFDWFYWINLRFLSTRPSMWRLGSISLFRQEWLHNIKQWDLRIELSIQPRREAITVIMLLKRVENSLKVLKLLCCISAVSWRYLFIALFNR